MEITKLSCPSCGGILDVRDGDFLVKCSFCSSQLGVTPSKKLFLLQAFDQIVNIFRAEGQAIRAAIQAGNLETQQQLLRMLIGQRLTSAETQLALKQSEIRQLERGDRNRVARGQLRDLRQEVADLQLLITDLKRLLGIAPPERQERSLLSAATVGVVAGLLTFLPCGLLLLLVAPLLNGPGAGQTVLEILLGLLVVVTVLVVLLTAARYLTPNAGLWAIIEGPIKLDGRLQRLRRLFIGN